MQRLDGYSQVFVTASAVHVGGLYLTGDPIPYAGAVAVIALAGLVWSRPLPQGADPWTRHALLAGLALLAWVLALPERSGLFAQALTAAACATIGLGVLGRAGPLRRWTNVPAIAIALLAAGMAANAVWSRPLPWYAPPDVPARAGAVLFPTLAVMLVGLAVTAALTSPSALRWAGAGLLPVLILSFAVLPAVLADDRFAGQPRTDAYADVFFTARVHVSTSITESGAAFAAVRGAPGSSPVIADIAPAEDPAGPSWFTAAVQATAEDLYRAGDHPGAALQALGLLLGLAATATSLFPYRR